MLKGISHLGADFITVTKYLSNCNIITTIPPLQGQSEHSYLSPYGRNLREGNKNFSNS